MDCIFNSKWEHKFGCKFYFAFLDYFKVYIFYEIGKYSLVFLVCWLGQMLNVFRNANLKAPLSYVVVFCLLSFVLF